MKVFKEFSNQFINTIQLIDKIKLNNALKLLTKTKKLKGRIFFLGVGGSAANASHAVNDFRKLCNIECYAPTDNISELTARTNDEGWETVFINWLKVSKLNKKDLIFIFSVGGGDKNKKISINLINALNFAKKSKTKSISVIANKSGYAALNSTVSIVLNIANTKLKTPVAESVQAFIWHYFVSHPFLQENKTKW